MRIEGTVLPVQCRSFGIGIDLVVDNCLWVFYPGDLSCKGKYIGYAISPKGVSYHVLRNLCLDKKVHLWLRKIRKARNNGKGDYHA